MQIEDLGLGMDQLGEFYTKVNERLKQEGVQCYITAVVPFHIDAEKIRVDVLGSEGAFLVAELDDNGWKVMDGWTVSREDRK